MENYSYETSTIEEFEEWFLDEMDYIKWCEENDLNP